jgi:deoxyribose-phosphate aldolase
MCLDIDKLVQQITDEVFNKVKTDLLVSKGREHDFSLASKIEHSLIRPDASIEMVEKLCQEAMDYGFANVCVSPCYVAAASKYLAKSPVKVCTAIDFPLGASTTRIRVAQAVEAVENGVNELDLALNVGMIKTGDCEGVKRDIEEVIAAVKGRAKVKAIIQTEFLTDEEKVKACITAKMAGVDFLKISAGASSGGVKLEDIKLARKAVGPEIGIKADGGIKTYSRALALLEVGATRIGASRSVAIVTKENDSLTDLKDNNRLTTREIAKMIDHSLLRPHLTREQVIEGCRLAKEYDVASVCVKPCDVEIAREELRGTDVLVTTVIGFPHGAHVTEVKVFEAEKAIKDGAVELDMVLNIGRLLSREFDYVERDIKAVVDVAHEKGVIVKVILENAYLTDELKEIACRICERAGADFVKTSTGFAPGGATISDLKLMRDTCSEKVRIKAAGGVRTLDDALSVRTVGTERFGATATKAILKEAARREADGTLTEIDQPRELGKKY